MNPPVVVIGGGISGLACAYRLFQLGLPVTLLESEARVGGLIGTVEQDGFLFETGPQSFQGTDSVLDVIRDIGLENHLEQADPRAPRYVLRDGKLEKIPMSPQAILGSSLLGLGSRWRVATEALRRTKPPSEEESVAAIRPAEIRARDSGISCLALRIRRLRGRSRKTQSARRLSDPR